VARRAVDGEVLTTLDGEDRKLDHEMAVIADSEGVVGLAGIMGGANSEIGDETVDVLLEAAHFDALTIRRAARRLGMHTEASHRFERGADPEMQPLAVDLAAAMMAELAGGRVCRGRIDVCPHPFKPRVMELDVAALSVFAGLEIPADRVVEIFDGLGFAPQLEGHSVSVTVPSFRIDIERIPDLYEEVIRHVGYSAIPSAQPVLPAIPGRRHPNWELVDRARSAAVGAGLAEVMNWSFISPEDDQLVASQGLCPGEVLALDNPLAQTQGVMRRSLLPGLLAAASANFNQGETVLAVFEQGRVFSLSADGPVENERLGVVLAQPSDTPDALFRRLKGLLGDVMHRVGLPSVTWRPGGAPWLDQSAGAELVTGDGAVIGIAGMLSDEYRQRWDLRSTPAVAELDLGLATEPELPQFQPLARHPAVVVDMTVEHSEQLVFADLEATARELAGEWVEDVAYVTKFEPGPGVVRTTLRLVYRHPERSLTQDEVNLVQEELRSRLADKLGVSFA
jgi:phenylalanyl-tRNA synthetase beta chain